jgi:type III pantothenate kinase
MTPVPIVNKYDTPHTLGQDRLAAAVGAKSLCPNENLLIIDAGSAITYDFVTDKGEYMGGNIAPGIKMRFTILQRMTKKLPLVETEENELIPLFGKNTRDAIAAGVIRGIAYEVKGYMRTLREKMDHFHTFLTGGNAPYILNNVRTSRTEKREIRYEKNLVLIGLNTILIHNKTASLKE